MAAANARPPELAHTTGVAQLRQLSTDEILAATAHELRLPLSHIKGFVTTLLRTDVTWDDETQADFIAEIDREADRLTELVDALVGAGGPLDSSDGPAADLAFTHPASVVRGALHRVRGLLADRPLHVDLPTNLRSVRMNASQMERVLANLIQNAIKYSPPGLPVGVSARIRADGDLEFRVEDEGPGIPAEDRERIFEPFFREQSAEQSNVPGHGLGLAICQSIVLAHGGRMRVSNRPRGGARFSVFLPAQVQAQAALQQPCRQWLRRSISNRWHRGLSRLETEERLAQT